MEIETPDVPVQPSQSEIEILQSLWARKTATVRQIHNDIKATRDIGYTTTLKQIQRMVEKKLVEKVSNETRSHTYAAILKPTRTRKSLLERLIDSAFGGSSNALVMQALGQAKPSKAEIEEIRVLLDKLEEDQRG